MPEGDTTQLPQDWLKGTPARKVHRYGICLPVCVLLLTLSGLVQAHALGQSYLFLGISEDEVAGRFEITIEDLNKSLSIDLKTDHSVTKQDFVSIRDRAWEYLQQRVRLSPDGRYAELRFNDFDLKATSQAQYLALSFAIETSSGTPEFIDFEYEILFDENPDHRGFVVVENDWKTGTFNNEAVVSLIFGPDQTTGRLDLSSSTIAHGFWEMTKLGVHHIWIGIDHILFLLALLLPSVVLRKEGRWQASVSFRYSLIYVLKIVTLFTIAHTITLSAATLGSISISSRLVESVIAISIAIAAVDVLRPVFHRHIWWIVFVFGLFHGLGFATVLSEIGVPGSYMAYSLLAFNIGVELGQLAIVSIAFPLLYLIRQSWFYRRFFLPAGATALILISMYWFVERGFLIDLPAGEYANWVLDQVSASG